MTVVTLMSSCKKDFEPLDTIPPWLKQSIARDMTIIWQSPHLVNNYGAWYKYVYMGEPYYQYENPLSSSWPQVFDVEGDRVNVFEEPHDQYFNMRCCKKLIWKAPRYYFPGI
jgi:hypothetical protein